MEEIKTSFEPSFEIVLANIGLIRKSVKIYLENCLTEFHSFFKDNSILIIESVPELKNMMVEIGGSEISFWKENWHTSKEDFIYFVFEWTEMRHGFKDNPYIGISVPIAFRGYREFNKMLEAKILISCPEISINYSSDSIDKSIVKFKYIDIAKYNNGEKFNSKIFLDDIVSELKRLVQLNDTIDEILKKLNSKK